MNAFLQNLWYWLDLYGAVLLLVLALALLGMLIWLIVQQVQFSRLRRHYRALAGDGEGGDLEALLDRHMEKVQQAVSKSEDADLLTRQLQRAGRGHLQHCGVVRFNPFVHTGGDQSFSIALADAEGNGVTISSLHSREASRIFAKPLVAWESTYNLTEEEQQAIKQARGG